MTLSQEVLAFYDQLRNLPPPNQGVLLHNPLDHPARREAVIAFCNKFYNDQAPRVHVLGINPNKPAATSSGVHYTDGFALDTYCGIPNNFSKSRELTARFFYMVVSAFGGAGAFYEKVFAWSIMPLGITEGGHYKNYYDDNIFDLVKLIINMNFEWLCSRAPHYNKVVVLGTGDNKTAFEKLAGSPFCYDQVVYLPHPRWILQYHPDKVDSYVQEYIHALSS